MPVEENAKIKVSTFAYKPTLARHFSQTLIDTLTFWHRHVTNAPSLSNHSQMSWLSVDKLKEERSTALQFLVFKPAISSTILYGETSPSTIDGHFKILHIAALCVQ